MAQEHQAVTLAELAAAGTTLTPEEAAALTLAVAERLGWSEPPACPERIVVRADGTVHLPRPANAAPALPRQYADLLKSLLTLGRDDVQPGVPGALLLLIARARGEIDLPAFASADEFRHALVRLLPRPGAHVIAAAMARWRPSAPEAPLPARAPERRVVGPRVDELRRMLREADLERIALIDRIQQHEATALSQRALAARLAPAPGRHAPRTRRRRDTRGVLAAGLAALSISAGGLFWTSSRSSQPKPDAPADAVASSQVVASPGRPIAPTVDANTTGAAQAPTSDRPAEALPGAPVPGAVARTDGPAPATAEGVRSVGAEDIGLQASEGLTRSIPAPARERETAAADPLPVPQEARSPRGGPGSAVREALHTLPVASPTAYSPSFSPDGGSVYFHAGSREGSRLMRADTDDSGGVREVATIVDDGAQNFHVRLSPDGSRVAFDSDRDGVRGVYVADRDGTNVRRVSGPGYAAVPVWSPDGRQLLYVRAEPRAPRTWNLWRLSLDRGTQQQLTTHRYGQAWPGSWFGDGQQICYTHEDRMYVLDLRTGRSQSITSPVPGRLVRTAAVSPNGTYVVFQVHRDGMWLLDLRDRTMRRVLEDPTAEEFTWSPDGRRIAFHSRREGHWGVWVMASPS